MNKNPLKNFYETSFHTAALWGAITFVQSLCGDQKVSIRQVIEEFRRYIGYDENTLPLDNAMMAYYRLNDKIRTSLGKTDKSTPLFPSEIRTELSEIRNALNFHLDNTCNMTGTIRKIDPAHSDGAIFEHWFNQVNTESMSKLSRTLNKHRSAIYQLFKSGEFNQKTWTMLRKIGYNRKIKQNIINEQKTSTQRVTSGR